MATMIDPKTDYFMKVKDVAPMAELSEKTIRKYIKIGKIPAYRFGPRCIRVKHSDVFAFIEAIKKSK